MSGLEALRSTDAHLPERAVASGYNFREVAPEVLSPLSWSVIGAGMEHGFRELARALGIRPARSVPQYTAYRELRPFHVVSEIEQVIAAVPGVHRVDAWEFLLGGPPPVGIPYEREFTRWGQKVLAVPRELRVLASTRERFGDVALQVQRAEAQVGAARGSQSAWTLGAAAETAVSAGRAAWALHMLTTCSLVAGGALLRRLLEVEFDRETASELLRSMLRRPVSHEPLAGVSTDPDIVARVESYEVADQSPEFASWQRTKPRGTGSQFVGGLRQHTAEEMIPAGSVLNSMIRRSVGFVNLLLSEREASKILGLRALHCIRLLLDTGAMGYDPGEAALLTPRELRVLPRLEQRRLVALRADELGEARRVEVPIDFVVRQGRIKEISRQVVSGDFTRGTPLAPGWGEGVASHGEAPGAVVLVGRQVESHDVLAVRPAAVVTDLGSILSHLAIVCRELGIPIVAGVETGKIEPGAHVAVDGWSGRVEVSQGGRGEA